MVAGLTACGRSVSDIDLESAKSRASVARERASQLDAELKKLVAEEKELRDFSGPGHEARMKQAETLRGEKAQMEGIKAEVEAKVEKFTADAKAHREALSKEKP